MTRAKRKSGNVEVETFDADLVEARRWVLEIDPKEQISTFCSWFKEPIETLKYRGGCKVIEKENRKKLNVNTVCYANLVPGMNRQKDNPCILFADVFARNLKNYEFKFLEPESDHWLERFTAVDGPFHKLIKEANIEFVKDEKGLLRGYIVKNTNVKTTDIVNFGMTLRMAWEFGPSFIKIWDTLVEKGKIPWRDAVFIALKLNPKKDCEDQFFWGTANVGHGPIDNYSPLNFRILKEGFPCRVGLETLQDQFRYSKDGREIFSLWKGENKLSEPLTKASLAPTVSRWGAASFYFTLDQIVETYNNEWKNKEFRND